VIPGGLTKKLQLLYFSVKCSFKNHIHAKWKKWVSEGINTPAETIVVSLLLFCEYILAAPHLYHIRIFFPFVPALSQPDKMELIDCLID